MVDTNLHGLNLGHQEPGDQPQPDNLHQPDEPAPGHAGEEGPPQAQPPLSHEEVAELMAHIARLEAQIAVAPAPAPIPQAAINPSVILQQAQFAAAAAMGTAGNIPEVMVGHMAAVDLTCEFISTPRHQLALEWPAQHTFSVRTNGHERRPKALTKIFHAVTFSCHGHIG